MISCFFIFVGNFNEIIGNQEIMTASVFVGIIGQSDIGYVIKQGFILSLCKLILDNGKDIIFPDKLPFFKDLKGYSHAIMHHNGQLFIFEDHSNLDLGPSTRISLRVVPGLGL